MAEGSAGAVPFPRLIHQQSGDAVQYSLPIPLNDIPNILAFCKAEDLPVTSLLYVAWALVVRSFTASHSVAFGCHDSRGGNHGKSIEDLVCRLDINDSDSIMSILRKTTSNAAYTTDLRTPSVNTLVLVKEAGDELISTSRDDIEFHIVLEFEVRQKCNLQGTLHCTTSRLSKQQATHVANFFNHIASTIIIQHGSTVGEFDLVSRLDAEQIDRWNKELPHVTNVCVHHSIAQTCSKTPLSLAISSWDGDVTYEDLHEQSSCLAEHLFVLGACSGQIVPLLFEKSKWAIVAMLGVVKAGAAFVFLDASHPQARLKTIAQTVGARLVLTSPTLYNQASLLAGKVLCVDGSQEYWCASASSSWSQPQSRPTDALYVVFTSGTSGKPKGVLIEHAAFSTRAAIAGPALRLDQKPRVLQFSSYSFSFAYRDILNTLIWGGCLCIPSEAERKNDLSSFIVSYNVSWAALTPSVMKLLSPQNLPCLKTVVVGGERISRATLEAWVGHVHMMQSYGLSEGAGVNALQTNVTRETDSQNIGHGLASCLWLVDVDDHEKLVPVGCVGEIVLEGPGLGREYIGQPEKTAKSFLSSTTWLRKFRGVDNGRLYKTGDLGRYDAVDGTVIYLGRKDSQVKLNGQLIELTEIEHHLEQCFRTNNLKVPNLAVEVTTFVDNDKPRILACIETGLSNASADTPINPSATMLEPWQQIKGELARLLPSFMVPFAFIPVQRMPMTVSGKKDRMQIRKMLGSLSLEELQSYKSLEKQHEAPSEHLERELQSLWAEALDQSTDKIGRHSDIFQLGGDSVTAMALVGSAREAGLCVTVDTIFRNPVLCDQAKAISDLTSKNPSDKVLSARDCPPFSLVDKKSYQAILALSQQQYGITMNQVEDVYPCTALQEGMVAATLRSPYAYMAQYVYRLSAYIEEDHYKAAWNAVIEANSILRTRILHSSIGVFQIVVRQVQSVRISHLDLQDYLVTDRKNLMTPGTSLLRVALVYDSSGKRYCVVTVHHSLYDVWSMRLIVEQLANAYRGFQLDRVLFSPFVQHIQHMEAASQAFWMARLKNCQATLFPSLPSTNYTPSPMSLTETVEAHLPKSSDHTTLSTRARLAWMMALSHYTGSDEVVFGAVVSGRGANVSKVEKMTGPTIATVPVRLQLPSSTIIRDALQTVQNDFLNTIPHEQLGLPQISKLNSDCLLASQFQSLLVIQGKDDSKTDDFMQRVDSNKRNRVVAFGTYALTLLCQVQDDNNSIHVQILFDDKIISAPQTKRILHHFIHILTYTALHVDTSLSSIPSISPQDMETLKCWNGFLPEPVERCLHDIIIERCVLQPENEAVCAWDGTFTYRELQRHARQLADKLLLHKVHHSAIVPICMTKSKHVPVAMLAILMAGGCFTFLDPAYPLPRIRSILHDTKAAVVLSNMPELASSLSDMQIQLIGSHSFYQCDRAKVNPALTSARSPQDLAYIAWTSGSTGKPKGAMVSHSSYATAVRSFATPFGFSTASRVLQFSSYAFDVSIHEILTTLIVGGCICIPSEISKQNGLLDAINDLHVNWMTVTPSVARLWRPENLPSVKTIVLGGESISEEDIRSWKNYCNVIIAYGPAECSVASTAHPNPLEQDANSIGTAVGGACWVVHPANHEVLMPLGAVGELLIEGNHVGQGYLGDPQKTAGVFIQSPEWLVSFRNGKTTRLYKTGDLVQYIREDCLRFVGRKDTQVKLHGQRLELGEVEKHVGEAFSYYGMATTVVAELIHYPPKDGKPVLVVFILVDKSITLSGSVDVMSQDFLQPFPAFVEACQSVRSQLFRRIPKHLVPAVFLPLRALPQTLSQKTDRKQLRLACSLLSEREWGAYVRCCTETAIPPSSNIEKLLHGLIQGVLTLDHFGMNDKFFQLGGDSIAAMKLSSIARERGFLLTVKDILSPGSLSDVATKMRVVSDDEYEIPPFALVKMSERDDLYKQAETVCAVSGDNIEDIYPCTPWQEYTMEVTTANPGAYVTNIDYMLPEGSDISVWRSAWKATFESNPVLRTRIYQGNNRTYQVVLRNEFTWTASEISDGVASEMGYGKPLSHVNVLSQQNGRTKISLTIHHALYDGWSIPAIMNQVEQAYQGEKLYSRPFTPFIKYLTGQDVGLIAAYWKTQLRGFQGTQFPALPAVNYIPNPSATLQRTYGMGVFSVTPASAIKLAWATTVAHHTKSDDVAFALTCTGRDIELGGINQITGPTMTDLPFRLSFRNNLSVPQLLQRVQVQSYEMIEHQHLGLRNISRLSADTAAACNFQHDLIIHPPPNTELRLSLLTRLPRRKTKRVFDPVALSMQFYPSKSSIQARMDFDENVVARAEAEEMLSHFGKVLDSFSGVQSPFGNPNA